MLAEGLSRPGRLEHFPPARLRRAASMATTTTATTTRHRRGLGWGMRPTRQSFPTRPGPAAGSSGVVTPTLYILTRGAAEESEGAHSASCVPSASITPPTRTFCGAPLPAAGLYEHLEQTNARAVSYVTALIVIDHRANVCKKWAGEKGLLTKWAALESNHSAVPFTPTLRR